MHRQRMPIIFNEWAKRYADNPNEFMQDILGEDGRPIPDYGELCTVYFNRLADELDAAGKLPKPEIPPRPTPHVQMEGKSGRI